MSYPSTMLCVSTLANNLLFCPSQTNGVGKCCLLAALLRFCCFSHTYFVFLHGRLEDVAKSISRKLGGQLPNYTGGKLFYLVLGRNRNVQVSLLPVFSQTLLPKPPFRRTLTSLAARRCMGILRAFGLLCRTT